MFFVSLLSFIFLWKLGFGGIMSFLRFWNFERYHSSSLSFYPPVCFLKLFDLRPPYITFQILWTFVFWTLVVFVVTFEFLKCSNIFIMSTHITYIVTILILWALIIPGNWFQNCCEYSKHYTDHCGHSWLYNVCLIKLANALDLYLSFWPVYS